MSQKIEQQFSIDVVQALKALDELDRGYQKIENRLASLSKALSGVNQSTVQVDKLGKAFNDNVPAAVQQTERLTTSLGLLSRIAFTQAVVRGLSILRNTLQDTAERAADFQKQIALTQTIADGASFDKIAASVRKLSDEFNLPLLQTAEGVYNALSNQVGDFGDSLKFTQEAAKFAKATNSSLKDSVDLLSAALKGYGLTVDDTDKVSSIFFRTIDKGRITATELANSFGRVDTLAADIGVSLEEVGGALAAISVKGTKTSEALTQFRAILSALQKPSETMEKRLASLGFTSSEVAIKTLGLTGVLNELSRTTAGSAEDLAKLFPNIRGLSGVASLTSDDLKELTSDINAMTEAGRNFNHEKFLVATATDGERVRAELNKLSNFMTVDLGQAALDTADKFFTLTGGADRLIEAAKAAALPLGGIAGGILAIKIQAIAAQKELTGLSRAAGLLALVPVAASVGNSIGSTIEDKRLESLFKDLRGLEAADKDFLAQFTANQKSERDEFGRTTDARVKAALQANRSLNAAYLQDVQNAQNAEQQKQAGLKFLKGTPVDEAKLGKLLNRSFPTPDSVSRGIIDAGKEAVTLKQQIDDALAGQAGIERLKGNIDQLFQELPKSEGARLNTAPALQQQFAVVLKQLQELQSSGQITTEALDKVIAARNQLGMQAQPFIIDRLGFASTLNVVDEMLSKFQAIQQAEDKIGDVTSLQQRLEQINAILQQAAPQVPFQQAASALDSGVVPAERIANAMERAAAASERIQFPAVESIGAQFGHFFASGGQARGVDTVPAMLTPGEMVINAKSTQRFRSQLQAMNAGKNPVFRQDGGSVTDNSTNIGDVSINVAGGRSPIETAREVARVLKREGKRGTT